MPPQKWVVRRVGVLSRFWDDGEAVVFSEETGETHQLNAFAARAFLELEAEPLTLSGLAGRLRRHLRVTDEDELSGHVEELVRRLSQLGLIEPVF